MITVEALASLTMWC